MHIEIILLNYRQIKSVSLSPSHPVHTMTSLLAILENLNIRLATEGQSQPSAQLGLQVRGNVEIYAFSPRLGNNRLLSTLCAIYTQYRGSTVTWTDQTQEPKTESGYKSNILPA